MTTAVTEVNRVNRVTEVPRVAAVPPPRLLRRLTTAAALLLLALTAGAGTQLGDAGHYLTSDPEAFVLNPDGRAFRLTLHRFPWWIGTGWNQASLGIKVTDAAGTVLVDKAVDVPDTATVEVPAGKPGAWSIAVDARNTLNYWYLECSLEHAVLRVAPKPKPPQNPVFSFNPFVPRTWYFWVPPGTERFRLKALNMSGRSHREDHGLTLFSPRGQRMAVLWGQANPDAPKQPVGPGSFAIQEADVIVEAGSAGRFWALEIRMGDSHTYSDVNVVLEGVPPYLARSPEEWFNPETGTLPAVPLYDDTEFVQSDRAPGSKSIIQHWTPCPALGDPDGCELRTPARLALLNPDDRKLKLVIGTYLPRNMFPDKQKPAAGPDEARVTVTAPSGTDLEETVPLLHLHEGKRWQTELQTGKGVSYLDVTGTEHFWGYTYPATPAVLVPKAAADGWQELRLEAGTARNWYFLVPRGTTAFQVRAAVAAETDVLELRVAAPDRTVAAFYGPRGTCDVRVPAGLDGKLWHVRLDVGDATRFESTQANPRYPTLAVTLGFKGVPGYIAPTREQWFDPAKPQAPLQRDSK